MNGFKKWGFLAICVLGSAAAGCQAATVADQDKAGFEVGIGLGQANLKETITTLGSNSDDATGYSLFGGYRFDRYFSVESGYLDGGKYSWSLSDSALSVRADLHLRAAQFSGVGRLPLGQYFGIFGRVGADHWWADGHAGVTQGATTLLLSETDTATSFMWGAGAEAFLDGAKIRVEYQQSTYSQDFLGIGDADIRHRYIGASIVWLF